MTNIFWMIDPYDNEPEYCNLTEEEKMYVDYSRDCLFNESEVIMDACGKMQLLLLEVCSKLNTEEEIPQDELIIRINEIYSGLSKEDKETVESFLYACIQTIGIYSEEAVKERKLKKKGND